MILLLAVATALAIPRRRSRRARARLLAAWPRAVRRVAPGRLLAGRIRHRLARTISRLYRPLRKRGRTLRRTTMKAWRRTAVAYWWHKRGRRLPRRARKLVHGSVRIIRRMSETLRFQRPTLPSGDAAAVRAGLERDSRTDGRDRGATGRVAGRGRRGDLPSFAFAASAQAITWNGLQPVFVDVDPDHWHLDPEALERALTARRGRGAVVVARRLPTRRRDRRSWRRARGTESSCGRTTTPSTR